MLPVSLSVTLPGLQDAAATGLACRGHIPARPARLQAHSVTQAQQGSCGGNYHYDSEKRRLDGRPWVTRRPVTGPAGKLRSRVPFARPHWQPVVPVRRVPGPGRIETHRVRNLKVSTMGTAAIKTLIMIHYLRLSLQAAPPEPALPLADGGASEPGGAGPQE